MRILVIPVMLLLATCTSLTCFAQTDTTYLYLTASGDSTGKENAVSYTKFFKKEKLWAVENRRTIDNTLRLETTYTDSLYDTPVGTAKFYDEKGILNYTAGYENGKVAVKTFYYPGGSKKSYVIYKDKGETEQKGFDSTGNEIPGYIVERPAKFKGGPEAWRKYLERNLNSNVPVDAGCPAGTYTVIVSFLTDKEGKVSLVKADNIPAKCPPCAAEAVRVINKGPAWDPAIQNNRPVVFRQKQSISFMVTDRRY